MRRVHLISALMLILSVMVFTGCDNVVVPTVVTGEVVNITETSCDVGGMVLDNGGSFVIDRGVCYGTDPNPDVTGDFVSNNYGLDTIYCHISGLTPGTTYYVRAYALNIAGAGYGESVKFTTQKPDDGGEEPDLAPEGAINGLFSVSETEKVYFSKGNLQYQASTDTWSFAEQQWNYVGDDNKYVSESYNGWIDLFGWGTSGWNPGNTYYHPWNINDSDEYYGPYGVHDLTGEYAYSDWGHNSISNGGNQPNQWRTLAVGEWRYVLNTRATTSGMRYAKAQVNGVNGVILLPDDWQVFYYTFSNANNSEASYFSNTISLSDWSTLEQHGAVFLPAAGLRMAVPSSLSDLVDIFMYDVGSYGNYWSASAYDNEIAWLVVFGDNSLEVDRSYNRSSGCSVRLVCSAQ